MNYKQLLNPKDPTDKKILDLAEKGILKVTLIKTNGGPRVK